MGWVPRETATKTLPPQLMPPCSLSTRGGLCYLCRRDSCGCCSKFMKRWERNGVSKLVEDEALRTPSPPSVRSRSPQPHTMPASHLANKGDAIPPKSAQAIIPTSYVTYRHPILDTRHQISYKICCTIPSMSFKTPPPLLKSDR